MNKITVNPMNLNFTHLPLAESKEQNGGFFGQLGSQIDRAHELQILEKELKIQLHTFPEELKSQVINILLNLLQYPSTQYAEEHQNANRLGLFDLKKDEVEENSQKSLIQQDGKAHCRDCGMAIQTEEISICTSFHSFPSVGIAAFLCFQTAKNLIFLLAVLAVVYSGYALYVNITEPSSTISLGNFPKKMSFASTIQNLNTNNQLYSQVQVEGWLIVATVVTWWVGMFIMKYIQIKEERMIDEKTVTAADFSIMFENVPVSYTKADFQKDINKYYDQLTMKRDLHQKDELKPFTISKFCKAIPFYYLDDETIKAQIAELEEKICQKREEIAELIEDIKEKGVFSKDKQTRKILYDSYEGLREDRKKKENELKELARNPNYPENQNIKTTVFVSFQHSETANLIEHLNPQGFSNRVRYYLSCCRNAFYFHLDCEEGTLIEATRAPEPEDIIWENIGIPDREIRKRKMFTYFITLLLLGVSFGIVYGLTILQLTYENSILSIAISLSITVINIAIDISIRKLTLYESDISSIHHQTSLAIKSIFSQLTNSIIVPVVTNLYIEKNIYEVNGLVYDIFYLSITTALLPPILKFIDIPYIIKKVTIWRNDRPYEKLSLNQKEFTKLLQLDEFQLGVAQIYYINIFYFTCFYVHIHPCIVGFALIGCILMYWAQKRSLLYHSNRPTPSSALLNQAMGQLTFFSSCVLSLGAFLWFNVIREDYHDFTNLTYISHLASLSFSTAFFLIPFNSIFNAICYVPDNEDLTYEESRAHLTSQYDLLNPVTAEEGLQDFLKQGNKKHTKKSVFATSIVNIFSKATQQKKPNGMMEITDEEEINETNGELKPSRNKKTTQKSNQNMSDDLIIEENDDENNVSAKSNIFHKPRRSKHLNITPKNESRKSVIHDSLQGYNVQSLKKSEDLPKENPYKDLKF